MSKFARTADSRGSAAPTTASETSTTISGEDADADVYGYETRHLGGTKAAFQRPWHRDKRWWIRWPAQVWKVTGQRFVPQSAWSLGQGFLIMASLTSIVDIGHTLPAIETRLHIGQRLDFRPATNWYSRWLSYAWRQFRLSGGYDWLLRPLRRNYMSLLLVYLPLALLLVFLPLALVAVLAPWDPNVIFSFSFLAVIPLSGLIQSACEDISTYLHPAGGKLLVAFSDNLVELVVGIVALCKGDIRLALLSTIGSVLCYSLLIMGSCFFVSGMRYSTSSFNYIASTTITSLNFFAVCCLLLPSTLHMLVRAGDANDDLVLILSREFAIILLIIYIIYLIFRIRTHTELVSESDDEDLPANSADWSLGPMAATILLAVSLTCLTLCMVSLVSSIPSSIWRAKTSFLGCMLFPFLGSVPDYLSAVVAAWEDQMDITILVTVGSSTQLLLFNLPVLVILGWFINKPLVLSLNPFEIGVVFLGGFIATYVVANGRSNYLSGAMCIALYAIIALAAFLNSDSPLPA